MPLLGHLSVLALAIHWTPSQAQYVRPNDKPLKTANLSEFDCRSVCEANIAAGLEKDRKTVFGGVPFDDSFYATASNFSTASSKPGDLLKLEPYIHESDDYSLPGGSTVYRIQYVSLGVMNESVPVTGFIVLPYTRPTGANTKIPLVAYAHGTIGTLYGCAPSSSFKLYDYSTWQPLYYAGYAIVGTDYQGLGNNYTAHPYLANNIQANDVYFSAIAAKRAFPDVIGDQWAATGHSQGGGAVWGLLESEYVTSKAPFHNELPFFVGGVAISPGIRIADIADVLVANGSATLNAYAPFIYAAINATNSGNASSLLTKTMNSRIELGTKLGVCLNGGGSLGLDLFNAAGLSGLYSSPQTLGSDTIMLKFQRQWSAGVGKPIQAPMRIVQSTADMTVPYQVTKRGWQAACSAGGFPTQLSLYDDVSHHFTPGASSPEWLEWLADRFAGQEDCGSCDVVRHRSIDAGAAVI